MSLDDHWTPFKDRDITSVGGSLDSIVVQHLYSILIAYEYQFYSYKWCPQCCLMDSTKPGGSADRFLRIFTVQCLFIIVLLFYNVCICKLYKLYKYCTFHLGYT